MNNNNEELAMNNNNSNEEPEMNNNSSTSKKSNFGSIINAFLNASRQVSNTYESNSNTPKIQQIVNNIEKHEKPALVYSNFLENGLLAISQALQQRNLRVGLFTGSISESKKVKLIEQFNNYYNNDYPEENKLDVLCVSSSGGEGIDLKNTRQVHITEPDWNPNKIEQVISRAFRYKSHAELPEIDRNIKVFKYLSVLPNEERYLDYSVSSVHRKERIKKVISIDQKMYSLGNIKLSIIREFEKLIRDNSIETNTSDLKENLNNEITLLNNVLEELVYLKRNYDIQILKENDAEKKENLKKELDKINNEYVLYNDKISKLSILLNNINIREQIKS